MASERMFQIFFLSQSVVFIFFIISFYQSGGNVNYATPKTHVCKCNGTRDSQVVRASSCGSSQARGRLSNCSLTDIWKRPGVVLLTSTNLGFLDMTMNLLMSIRRVGVCINTTIVAEDQKAYRYLSRRAEGDPGIHVIKTSSGDLESGEILRKNPKAYYDMMNKRQAYILPFLQQGLDVLFTDSDTFWFRDPFPFFEGDFDISLIDSRNSFGVRNTRSNFCAGFVYFKPTSATTAFLKGWIQEIAKHGWRRSDQTVMNGLLHADRPLHVNIKPLDTNLFPWGPKFYSLLERKANYSTVMMHAASIRGHGNKVAKFQSSDMWLVNATSEELIANFGV